MFWSNDGTWYLVDVPGLSWPTNYPKEKVLRLADPTRISFPQDRREKVGTEDTPSISRDGIFFPPRGLGTYGIWWWYP